MSSHSFLLFYFIGNIVALILSWRVEFQYNYNHTNYSWRVCLFNSLLISLASWVAVLPIICFVVINDSFGEEEKKEEVPPEKIKHAYERKFNLTNESITYNGHTLYRIEAIRDFGSIKKGDKGGFVEKEFNLSQFGECWVGYEAKVYENGFVCHNSQVFGNANVFGNAKIGDEVRIFGNSKIFGDTKIEGNAQICDDVLIYDNAQISGNVYICGKVRVYGNAKIYGHTNIDDCVEVCGDAVLYGSYNLGGDALIKSIGDCLSFQNNWSSGRYFTWTRSNNMWLVGCFYGTGKELIEKAYQDSPESGKKYEAFVKMVESTFIDK